MKCSIFFSGDYIIRDDLNTEFLSEKVKKEVQKNDIICCNLEGPIINKDMKERTKIGPNISNSLKNVEYLIKNNFNLFCLANNHIFDYGKEGIENTIKILKENKVKYIGASTKREEIYKRLDLVVNEVKIGIINVSENGFGAAPENEEYGYAYMLNEEVEKNIIQSKMINDFTIVICHAGAEQWIVPLPEIRRLYKKFIDIGADAVVAHHPHVPQGYERYNEKVIFYSLGNFIFNKGDGFLYKNTFCVSLELEKNKKIEFKIIPICVEQDVVKIDESIKVEIEKRTEILKEQNKYMEIINKYCLEYYNNIYKKLYYKVASIYKGRN